MNYAAFTSEQLLKRLSQGWSLASMDAPQTFVARLATRWLGVVAEGATCDNSVYESALILPQIRLRGASDLGVLIVGPDCNATAVATRFWDDRGGGGRLNLIIAVTAAARQAARNCVPAGRCAVVTTDELAELFHSHSGIDSLRKLLLRELDFRRLVPYNITRPAPPNMFFGRRALLERMHQEETLCMAIVGPGRLGKSSVLKQYLYEVKSKLRDPRRERIFYFDCYSFANQDPEFIARQIATQISTDAEARRVHVHTFESFLQRITHEGRHPMELLLDEMDQVCLSPICEVLAECVRNGLCRVVLCGRGGLYRMLKRQNTQFSKRLTLIRPEPLDAEASRHLFLDPLVQLELALEDEKMCLALVDELSGRRPQLVQQCAQLLIEYTLEDGSQRIKADHLSRMRVEFEATAHSQLPLEELEDDYTRFIVLVWLREGGTELNVGTVLRLGEHYGITISGTQALEICDDLWINNILSWENNTFRLAYLPLIDWVRRQDFGPEITRLRERLLAQEVSRRETSRMRTSAAVFSY